MKIAYDYKIFSSQAYGGVSRYFTDLGLELLKRDLDVHFFCGLHINNYLSELPENVITGLKLDRFPPKSARLFQSINQVFTDSKMSSWKPDLIHETYYSNHRKSYRDAKKIITVYDMIHEKFPEHFSATDKTSHKKAATIARADHVICISDHTKKDLIEILNVPEEKITVIHLGYDFSSDEDNSIPHLSLKQPFLLYVGSRRGYKNFSAFLRAFVSSPQLKSEFNVIAFGGGKFTPDEIKLIRELGLDERQIHQIGGNDQILADLYSKAEAFIYPSLYEGFGLPPLEAMAAGCPVVTSNTSSMPEVVRQAGEYFDPTEVVDIQEAIERVVFSSQRKADLIRLGYENIKHFSWEKCAEETLKVYQQITGIA